MKTASILLLAFCLQVNAGTNAQSITLTEKNSSLEKILKEIKQQTGYDFWYENKLLQKKKKVTIEVRDASLDEVLGLCFREEPITWSIVGTVIVLKQKTNVVENVSHDPIVVRGKITNDKGDPMAGVSIGVKGLKTGTTTSNDGSYEITVPDEGAVLVISFVGYATKEIKVGNQQNISIRLGLQDSQLSDVVVIGYGTVRKRDLTGSVVSLKGDDLKEVPSGNPLDAAQGKIAGADITRSSGQAGSGINIRIRGNRSIGGNNSPLIIVDGVQYNSIQDINPNDIESMEILKDASSVAIYGSRGANGVILITTKKGLNGKSEVTVNSYAGISKVTMYPKAGNFEEYVDIRRQAFRTVGQWNSPADDAVAFSGAGELNAVQKGLWTDYQDLLIHDGFQQDHQIGVRAGTDKLKAYMSAGLFNEDGILKLDWVRRYTGRLNLDYTVNSKLKVGLQSQVTYYNQSVRRDPLNQANKVSPLGSVYDSTGKATTFLLDGQTSNPIIDEQPNVFKNSVVTTRTLVNGYAEIQPFTGFSIRTTLGVSLVSARNGSYSSPLSINRALSGKSQASISTSNGRTLNWENVVNYTKAIKDHSFTVTGIASYLASNSDDVTASAVNQLLPSQLFYALQNGTEQKEVSSSYSESDLISFAGRLNYSFKGKYLLTLTARQDGSSKLAADHKWTFFPSAAVAWRIIDENFMQKATWLSELKLRLSYGVAGNDPSGPYATQSALTRMAFGYDETPAPAYTFSRTVGNSDLGWELSKTKNIGLDIGVLNGRINAVIDYYDTHTSDLLLIRGLPPTTGVTSVYQNVGKTRNRGIELAINTVNIKNANLEWTSSLTFSKNKEEIVDLVTNGVDDIGNGWFIGHPINVYYDFEKIGIWQTKDAAIATSFNAKPGEIRVKDQDGDGLINTQKDRIILGTPRPKWSGGIENTVSYKGFDLSAFVFFRMGQMISSDRYGRYDPQGIGNTVTGVDYWTPENATNYYPRPTRTGGLLYMSTLTYKDGSYARIRNATIGYTVPARILKNGFVRNARAYFTAKNLHTFTKLDYDPERGGSENFPMTKLFVFGVNVTF
ncbi:MAG: TonB-dependent receptor [Chitinophagaceae bacterium]